MRITGKLGGMAPGKCPGRREGSESLSQRQLLSAFTQVEDGETLKSKNPYLLFYFS